MLLLKWYIKIMNISKEMMCAFTMLHILAMKVVIGQEIKKKEQK